MSQKGGVCYSHGAPYSLCKAAGCKNKIQQGGFCCRHGAKNVRTKCDVGGCRRNATRMGGGTLCGVCFKVANEEEGLVNDDSGRESDTTANNKEFCEEEVCVVVDAEGD